MKVLFINTVFPDGSTGKIIENLGRYLEIKGGEYKVAVGRGHTRDQHVYRIGDDVDLYCHALFSRISDRAGFYSRRATIKLIDFIKEYNPDIIHLHNLHGYFINLPVLFCYLKKEFKGHIIWTIHDCWAFTGHCTHFTHCKCEKWKTQCHHCAKKRDFPASYVFDSSTINYCKKKELFSNIPNLTIVTVSDWLKEIVNKSFLHNYPIQRIYNGIDVNLFAPCKSEIRQRYGINIDDVIILSVADGFDNNKGLPSIIKLSKVSPKNWLFVIIGIENRFIKSLPDNVLGLPRTSSQKELIEWYSEADVFFNPSEEETFGLVTVESMACGTPVVVMNSTASPELIVTEKCGAIIELTSDPKRMIDILNDTINKEGARNAAMFFTVDLQCANYYQLYKQCTK